MAAGSVTFYPPQAHEGEKSVFLEPALAALRLKGFHEVANFLFAGLGVEMHKYVGPSHVAVVFWDLVFQYQMIAKGIPCQVRQHPVILMPVVATMRQYQVGFKPFADRFKPVLDRRPLTWKVALAKPLDSHVFHPGTPQKRLCAALRLGSPNRIPTEYHPTELGRGICLHQLQNGAAATDFDIV